MGIINQLIEGIASLSSKTQSWSMTKSMKVLIYVHMIRAVFIESNPTRLSSKGSPVPSWRDIWGLDQLEWHHIKPVKTQTRGKSLPVFLRLTHILTHISGYCFFLCCQKTPSTSQTKETCEHMWPLINDEKYQENWTILNFTKKNSSINIQFP